MTQPETAEPLPQPHLSAVAELTRQLLLLLANVTVITALLVYFGWWRAEEHNRLLGFDQALLGMSTQEYVLRSIDQVLVLLAIVGGLGLIGTWAWQRLTRTATSPHRAAGLLPAVLIVAAVLLPAGFAVTFPVWNATAYTLWPLSVAAGILLLAAGLRLRGLRKGQTPQADTMTQLFLLLVLGVCLFTAASHRAAVVGAELADDFVAGFAKQPDVTVTSAEPLYLDGPGVTTEQLDESTYRYRGLKFVERTGTTVFLLPAGWRVGHGQLIVLSEGEGLRFAYGSTG